MATTGAPEHGHTRPNPKLAPFTPDAMKTGARQKDKKNLDYILRSGLAGGVAGCAAKTLIAPLDRVKILFQASSPHFVKYTGTHLGVFSAISDIQRHEGTFGLFKGHSATLLRIFPYAAIKFVAYEQFRAVLIENQDQETPLRRLMSGSLAGVTSVFFTYPLEVIRVRLAFETKKEGKSSSLKEICKRIHGETLGYSASSSGRPIFGVASPSKLTNPISGLANFYRGFVPTVLGMLPYAGISFLTHDMMGDWLRSDKVAYYTTLSPIPNSDSAYQDFEHKRVLKVWAQLLAGGFAGLCSQTASYPLEIIRRRMQVGGAVGNGKFLKLVDTARAIWRTGGFKGFFVGLSIGYMKIIPMTATSFFVYERSKLLLGI